MANLDGTLYCPSCQAILVPYFLKVSGKNEATISYCYSCGGFWCEHWTANNISYKEFQELAKDLPKYNEEPLLSGVGNCPFCSVRLQRLIGENIPANLNVYACPQCFGNWFPRGELLHFKSAQESKIDYLKKWSIPLKSIYQVLLPVLFLTMSVTMIYFTVQLTQKRVEQRTIASGYIRNVQEIISGENEVIIAFNSNLPLVSELVWEKNKVLTKYIISWEPQTFHQLKITSLQKGETYKYQILLHIGGYIYETPVKTFRF